MKKVIVTLFIVFILPTFVWADAYTLNVEGLVCDFCAQGIEKKLSKTFKDQHIKDIKIDLDKKTVTFESDKVDEKKLHELIKDAGYNLKNIEVKSMEKK